MVMLPSFQQLLQAITMEEMETTNSLQPTLTSLKLYTQHHCLDYFHHPKNIYLLLSIYDKGKLKLHLLPG